MEVAEHYAIMKEGVPLIYVTSDLHGYPLEQFQAMLRDAGFTNNDFLFILGDVIDRGPEGVELLRWIMDQTNMELILGNHESMLLSCSFLFDPLTDENLDNLTEEHLILLKRWMKNGAEPTIKGLKKLMKEDPDLVEGILDYLRDAPLFDVVDTGKTTFVLLHGGLENFDRKKRLSTYQPDEILWARPNLNTRYFSKATVILGHTPTQYFGAEYRGKAVHTDTWICIDTGAAGGGKPMLLRLDDMKEFY